MEVGARVMPLVGMHVLVTRPEGAATSIIRQLRTYGADVTHVPAIRTVPLPSYAAFDAALDHLGAYDWFVFTSATAVRFTAARFTARGVGAGEGFRVTKIAAIGAGTERELARYGVTPALVPPEAIAESLRDALLAEGVGPASRVLLPQPVEGRDVVAVGLSKAGASVDVVPAYQTVANTDGGSVVRQWLDTDCDKMALVTSPSTVRALVAMLDGDSIALARIPFACIGPVTAAAVTDLGSVPLIVATDHTDDGLVAALIDYAKGAQAA